LFTSATEATVKEFVAPWSEPLRVMDSVIVTVRVAAVTVLAISLHSS